MILANRVHFPFSPDTHPDADHVRFAIWRRSSGAQKLALDEERNAMSRALTEQRIRERHADADKRANGNCGADGPVG